MLQGGQLVAKLARNDNSLLVCRSTTTEWDTERERERLRKRYRKRGSKYNS